MIPKKNYSYVVFISENGKYNRNRITDLVLRKIVKNIKHERKKRKMSQLNLAMTMAHKSVSLISFIETGIKNQRFNLIHLISIVKILDI
jgi:ribosome-binding protein aMBF1 (putative translation factor)